MEEENNQNIFQSPPEYQSRLSRGGRSQNPLKKILVIIVFIVILGIIIFGAIRLITGGQENDSSDEPSPTIESFPTSIPTDASNETNGENSTTTPSPTRSASENESGLDRSDLSIHILNGGGVSGAGSKASDLLEELGYNVIQIGNAENFDYTETEIQIKASKEDFLEQLEDDLSSEYTVGTTSTDLDEDERPDVIIIIGAE